ncbi:unnamed protein product [Chrysodeixis includens]|uniref:Uncharacterized protein n=1 Tax=Chrysodeixis includens TaxID=689277 RepID=A0A9N8L145_CHRIL|nr:unnamed protein product [Chrysodeixis includens]
MGNFTVCSDHFRKEDLYPLTNRYKRKLKPGAIPILDPKYNQDACIRMRLCRVCLSLDRKMYPLSGSLLGEMYRRTRGGPVPASEDRLPSQLCWECAARLKAANSFRERAILTEQLLNNYLMTAPVIKYRDLKMIVDSDSDLPKSRFVIDNRSENIEAKDSVAGTINSNWQRESILSKTEKNTVQKLDIAQVTVKNEIDTTLAFDDDPNSMKNEIDIITNDITSDCVVTEHVKIDNELKNDVDITTDITSNSDGAEVDESDRNNDFYYEDTDFCENNASKTLVNNETVEKNKNEELTVAIMTADEKSKKQRRHTRPIDENLFTITHLSEEEEIRSIQERQYSERYLRSPHQCTLCYKGFPSQESYDRHTTKHSEKMGPYECNICKIRSATKVKAYKHKVGQHVVEISCKQCPFVTRSRNRVIGHMKYHAGSRYICQQCEQVFEKQTTYLNHLRLKHMSCYVCDLCGYTFVNPQGVRMHKRIIHRLNKNLVMAGPYCDVCEVRFLSEQAYETHLNLSSKHVAQDNPYRFCNESIKGRKMENVSRKPVRREAIRRRDRNAGPQSTTVSCEQCGEVFPCIRKYGIHFRKAHPGKQRTKYSNRTNPYLCELCGKIFGNYTTLSYHMWIHTGQKEYQCDHCKKTFSVKGNLASHMRLHDNKSRRSYDCRVCGKQFTSSHNRTRHMFVSVF